MVQQITAEITWLQIFTILGILIAIVGQIIGWINISNKNKEKYATKPELRDKINIMDKRISTIENTVEIHRKENLQAHRNIIDDIIKHMDTRFEDLKGLINSKRK